MINLCKDIIVSILNSREFQAFRTSVPFRILLKDVQAFNGMRQSSFKLEHIDIAIVSNHQSNKAKCRLESVSTQQDDPEFSIWNTDLAFCNTEKGIFNE